MAYSVGSFPVFTWSIRDLVLLSKPTVLTLASLLLSKGHAMLQCLLDYLFRLLPRACSVLGNGNLKWDLRFFFFSFFHDWVLEAYSFKQIISYKWSIVNRLDVCGIFDRQLSNVMTFIFCSRNGPLWVLWPI